MWNDETALVVLSRGKTADRGWMERLPAVSGLIDDNATVMFQLFLSVCLFFSGGDSLFFLIILVSVSTFFS